MTRLNIVLLMALIGCALSVVTSQHKARKLFMELQTEQERERKTDQEWRELQIESQTLGTGKRIEQKAQREMGMVVPDPKRTVIVVLDGSTESKSSFSSAVNGKKTASGDTEIQKSAETRK